MIHTIFKTLFILLISFTCQAQSFSATVSSDSILIGNYIKLSYTSDEVNGKFEAPELNDLNIVSGPNVSASTQIINGEYSAKKEISFHIRPIREGQIIIPPAYYTIDELTLETQPLELNVYPNPEGIIQNPQEKQHNFFFESFEFPFEKKEPQQKKKKKRKLKRL